MNFRCGSLEGGGEALPSRNASGWGVWGGGGEDHPTGLLQKGAVLKGAVQKGLLQKGPIQKGLIQKGPIQKGLVQKGPIQEGLIRKDFHHRFKPILHRFATQSIWQTPI